MKKLLILSLIAVSGSVFAVNNPVIRQKGPSPIPYGGPVIYRGGPGRPTNSGGHVPVNPNYARAAKLLCSSHEVLVSNGLTRSTAEQTFKCQNKNVGKKCTGAPNECGQYAQCQNNTCNAIGGY